MRFPFELPTNKPFDAVGFGLNAVDHLIVVPEYPAFDTKMRLLEHKQSAGGQTATALATCAALGLRAKFAGVLGSDQNGMRIRTELIRRGIDVTDAVVHEGLNQFAAILVDERTGELDYEQLLAGGSPEFAWQPPADEWDAI